MSLLNRISLKALCLALPAGTAVAACGAQGPASDVGESDSASATASVERLDLGGGAYLEFMQDEANGLMAVSAIGPEAAKEKLATLGSIQGGLAALYRAALPGREVPANVLAFDAKSREVPMDVASVDSASTPASHVANPVTDAGLGSVAKSAASFPGQFCNDQIDKICNISGWYWASNGCYVNSTNNWSRQLNTVRQGYAALEVYRGSVTLRSEWWNGSAWVLDRNTPVNQGYSTWRRLWSTTASPHTLRFSTVDATGDGYHVGVQSADTPIMEMPNKDVVTGQQYAIRCECTDGFRPTGTYFVRACLQQPSGLLNNKEYPTYVQADTICNFRCDATNITWQADTSRTAFQALPNTAGCRINTSQYVNL